MRPQDWFGVGLRLIGVWSIIRGADYFVAFVDQLRNFDQYGSGTNPNQYLIYTFSNIAIGVLLLIFASTITRLTYPMDERVSSNDEQSIHNSTHQETR